MTGYKSIVFALIRVGKTADTAMFTHIGELLLATGQYLMRICLVTDIPYDTVLRSVEDIVECYRYLYSTHA